jgi:hypothetical protein
MIICPQENPYNYDFSEEEISKDELKYHPGDK